MPKKPKLLKLDEADAQEAILRGYFEAFYQDKAKDLDAKFAHQDNKRTGIIIGVIVASFLVVLGIIVTLVWDSRTNYNNYYLDTRKSFLEEANKLRQENEVDNKSTEVKLNGYSERIDKIEEKQEYLEKLLLEKASER